MSEIRMTQVRKVFGKIETIHGVDLTIADGDFAVFVGPSGCGKSTLLRLIAGLEDISAGDLFIGGKKMTDVPPAERGVAMVFQSYALYPHFSVFDNMAFGLQLAHTSKEEIRQRVERVAEILQMSHLLDRKPRELSGGQRQRVAIGRAIVREPGVFLFDEPLSNLDAALRVQMRIQISRLHQRLKSTMVYVTHDQVEAMTLADRIVVLNNGYIEQVGSPLELYHYPQNTFVGGFIGSPKMNFLKGELADANAESATVKLGGGASMKVAADASAAKPGDQVIVGIRPEHVEFAGDQKATLAGEVLVVEQLGDLSLIYIQTQAGSMDEPLVAKEEHSTSLRVGETVNVWLPAKVSHLFNAEGKAFTRTATAEEEPALAG